jgi:DNA-nicking Smr family endonuclease
MTGDESASGRRRLSAHERALWSRVIRTVAPLNRTLWEHRRSDTDAAEPKRKSTPPPGSEAARGPRASSAPKAASLASLDRRVRQRLARGTEPIDGRLDLHGQTQAQAHAALLRFLRRAQAQGAKFVLVITGKGSRADDSLSGKGILKRQVPLWLQLPEFHPYVVGFEEANIGHGGEGALYVRVRRARGLAATNQGSDVKRRHE